MFQRLLVVFLLFILPTSTAIAQVKHAAKVKAEEVDAEAEQRREVAISLIVTLADEARADLLRAVQLTKSFTGQAPRGVATLAIARSVLEKRKERA